MPRSVAVPNDATFMFEGRTYRIGDIEPLEPTKICTDNRGRRWACGARSRIAFRNMVAGKWLRCRTIEQRESDHVIDCRIGNTTFSSVLTRNKTFRPLRDARAATRMPY